MNGLTDDERTTTREDAKEMARRLEAALREVGYDVSIYPRKAKYFDGFFFIFREGQKPPRDVVDRACELINQSLGIDRKQEVREIPHGYKY